MTFNNLLGVILNYTALIALSVTDPSILVDLGEVRVAAERGAALTRQLLTFARRDIANPEPVDVTEIIRSVASMLGRTLGEQVVLELDLSNSPMVVLADRHQLEQILVNLALNARDAMPDGGVLTILPSRLNPRATRCCYRCATPVPA
jgi:two-component system cell cycle sensor histidine kinase/response regulator CckA